MTMAHLPEHPSLADFQAHIKAVTKKHGWDKNSVTEIFLLFTEEVGELAKAIRNETKLHTQTNPKKRFELEEEFADVFNYLLDLANAFNVDLETAYRKKDAHNEGRSWKPRGE